MSETPNRRASDAPRVDRSPIERFPWMPASVIIAMLLFAAGGLTWLTGGIHPQWQSDIADLRAANAALRNDLQTIHTELASAQASAAAATQSDRNTLAARIDADKTLLTSRLDAMWRPSDFAERDAHLGRLDTVFDGLRERVTTLEYAQKDLAKQYQNLTTVPSARTK